MLRLLSFICFVPVVFAQSPDTILTQTLINEIRALHYEMLAYHARGDLAGYFKFNQAIHLKIVKYSGNAVLFNIYRQLNGNVRRARYMANLSKERWDAAMRDFKSADSLAPLRTWLAAVARPS